MIHPCLYPSMHTNEKGYIKVTGAASLKAVPDTAIVNMGVVTDNISLEVARRENSMKTANVINALTSLGIDKKQIITGAFSIDPIYDYINGKQTFRGYRVTNILTVTIKDIDRAGEVIDKATIAGVNRVDNVNFTVSDPTVYYDKALKLAIENAIHKSSVIGGTLDIEVEEVPCRIIERSMEAVPFETSAVKLSAAATPVMPGQIEIAAVVVAIFRYNC